MKVLVDTDAFCKLGAGGLLSDALTLLGANMKECGRLPALPYMLRKGRLRKVFGAETCDTLIPIASGMPVVIQPDDAWLDKLASVHAIDPGEAQIYAAAAQYGLFVMSGDKRALRALTDLTDFVKALSGRIVVTEAILLALCDSLEPNNVQRRVQGLAACDTMIRVCFSGGNPDPRAALSSYYLSLAADLKPLVLWTPRPRGGA